jgi:hypothetical protein
MEPNEMTKDALLMWYANSLRQHEIRFANMIIQDLKTLGKNKRIPELLEKYQLYIDIDK